MKKILLLMFLYFGISLSAQENVKSVNVTVYNNNLGVVREIRELDMVKGLSDIKIIGIAEQIDPTSVNIKLDGTVLEQNYQYDLVNLQKILQKYIDNDVDLIGEKELVSGTLLSVSNNSVVIKKKDGGLTLLPDLNKFQISVKSLPEGLITRPTLIWKVYANKQGKQNAELSYQTGGMNWHAEYVAVLDKDDKTMDLKAWVSVENNSGATFKDANLKLVSGDVNLVTTMNNMDFDLIMSKTEALSPEPMFQEKQFFEYHIYNLQKPSTISNNEIKQISLFEAENINITKKYLFKSNNYGSDKKVSVLIEFQNSKENQLGMPFPAGKVRLNKSDGNSLEFIGEDMIEHTTKDEKIILKTGDAFDLTAEEIVKEHKRITDRVQEKTFEIKLRNHKTEDVVIEVERNLGTNWEILESNFKYEKKDAMNVTFKIPVKKDKEETLTMKVRYVY